MFYEHNATFSEKSSRLLSGKSWDVNEEQGERFHQDIRVMEERLPGPMGLPQCGGLLLEPKERERVPPLCSNENHSKIFKFMMTRVVTSPVVA